jgi:hypothetical protein
MCGATGTKTRQKTTLHSTIIDFAYPRSLLLVLLTLQFRASLCGMDVTQQLDSVEQTPRLLFSRRSAARALDISVRMVDYAIASGLLETRRLNSRILIPLDSLAKFAASDRIIPKSADHCQECA